MLITPPFQKFVIVSAPLTTEIAISVARVRNDTAFSEAPISKSWC